MSLGPWAPGSQTAVGVEEDSSRRWNSWARRCWFASRMRSSIFSRARVDSWVSMSGSGCGIESDQFDESILGWPRGILCSPAHTSGDRCRTVAVPIREVIAAPSFDVRAPPCPGERVADAVEGVGLAERGEVPHLPASRAVKSEIALFGGLTVDHARPLGAHRPSMFKPSS